MYTMNKKLEDFIDLYINVACVLVLSVSCFIWAYKFINYYYFPKEGSKQFISFDKPEREMRSRSANTMMSLNEEEYPLPETETLEMQQPETVETVKVEEKKENILPTERYEFYEPEIPEEYIEVIQVSSTAYCCCYECCEKMPDHAAFGLTFSGLNLLKAKSPHIIAADLDVLPLGTKVYISTLEFDDNVTGDYGYATVEDIGGKIQDLKIDVYFPTHEQAEEWEIRMVNVYVISYPEE